MHMCKPGLKLLVINTPLPVYTQNRKWVFRAVCLGKTSLPVYKWNRKWRTREARWSPPDSKCRDWFYRWREGKIL